MQIQNDVIRALQQDEAHRKPKAGTAQEPEAFESLLAGEIQRANNIAANSGSLAKADPLEGQNATALALLLQSAEQLNQTEEAAGLEDDLAADSIERLLDKWDSYATALNQKGSDDLRGIYTLLQGMSAELQELKSARQELLSRDATLGSLVNELDVLTTSETIKFNRGDYL
jgi:hypothetical protein